jgi:Protein of unknown function (DUF1501)
MYKRPTRCRLGSSAWVFPRYGKLDHIRPGVGKSNLPGFIALQDARGVRFVQVFSGGLGVQNTDTWDAHKDMKENHSLHAKESDLPIAGPCHDIGFAGHRTYQADVSIQWPRHAVNGRRRRIDSADCWVRSFERGRHSPPLQGGVVSNFENNFSNLLTTRPLHQRRLRDIFLSVAAFIYASPYRARASRPPWKGGEWLPNRFIRG